MTQQNKGLFIGLGIVILIIVCGVGVYFAEFSHKAVTSTKNTKNFVTSDQASVDTLKPDDIGLSLAVANSGQSAGHAVDMNITKIDGITGVDYEFSYTYGDSLNQGGFGHLDVKSGDSSLHQEIILGTCSSGVCRYDANPTNFKVVLRVTKTDGKIYQVTKSFDL